MNGNLNGIDDSSTALPAPESYDGIFIDFNRNTGRTIKPLHGINNSPIRYGEPLPELADAGIPFVRLHDAGGPFGNTYLVDVPNLFPNFDADPDDIASYDFAYTDAYFKSLTASGMKIFYRLGVTIENYYRIKPQRIHPPRDFQHWAKICAGIVRHYNEGWADGFHYGIEYWEIWNEPENPPMWTGTREQYFELYRVTANYLKEQFPHIKVGGYASCGFYAVNRPNMNDFYKSFLTWYDEFLAFVTTPETAAPLDFYSWHLYSTDPHEIVLHADYVRQRLIEYGLDQTENIFDEWNYINCGPDVWNDMRSMPGACFVGAALCLMQKSPIDKAMYYDALPTRKYGGLYTFPDELPTKPYYVLKAFNELYRLGTEVVSGAPETEGVYVAAARNDAGHGAALVINRENKETTVAFHYQGQGGMPRIFLLDRNRVLTEIGYLLRDGKLVLPAQSVLLLRWGVD